MSQQCPSLAVLFSGLRSFLRPGNTTAGAPAQPRLLPQRCPAPPGCHSSSGSPKESSSLAAVTTARAQHAALAQDETQNGGLRMQFRLITLECSTAAVAPDLACPGQPGLLSPCSTCWSVARPPKEGGGKHSMLGASEIFQNKNTVFCGFTTSRAIALPSPLLHITNP